MFGLLGGLVGGGLRGGFGGGGRLPIGQGGILQGLMQRKSGGGSQMPGYSAQSSKAAPQDAPQQEASGQQKPPQQQEAAPEQPPQQAMSQEAPKQLAEAQPQQQQQQEAKSPIKGLLDEAKPTSEPREAGPDRPPEPPQFVNRTETQTPISRQEGEKFGQAPMLERTDTLANQLLDSGSNRQRAEFQEGLPAKTLDVSGGSEAPLGLQYQQSTTVASSVPARRYRT